MKQYGTILNQQCALTLSIDLNGNKGPNTVGKDIGFISALYSNDPIIVAPIPINQSPPWMQRHSDALKFCNNLNTESRLPNRDELSAMFFNRELIGKTSGSFWSGSVTSSGNSGSAWAQNFNTGTRGPYTRSNDLNVLCIKR